MIEHAMTRFAGPLVEFAEGRTEPGDWLAWWAGHEPAVTAVCPRGWLLRLAPKSSAGDPEGPLRTLGALARSHGGACYVLDKLGVAVTASTRYSDAYGAELARWERALRAAATRRAAELKPLVDGLAADFPRLARFLGGHLDEVESVLPGVTGTELDELATTVGVPLPGAYRTFLSHTRELVVGDTLRLTAGHPFVHTATKVALPTEGMLCFGEYWWEADGDQVLFDLRDEVRDDPPVWYYAHGRRVVEQVAPAFTAWLEALPRSLG